MNTPAPEMKTCKQCGQPMASDAPEGLCARCLLSAAIKAPSGSGGGVPDPLADGLFADAESGGGGAQRGAEGAVLEDHFCSRQRSENGISVHVVRAAWRAVECSSTTSLPDPRRADNLLKHDT